jgi:hypothetical protein
MRIVVVGFALLLLSGPLAQVGEAADPPPSDPEAREAWVAERRADAKRRRAEFESLSPEEQEAVRADRRARREARRTKRAGREKPGGKGENGVRSVEDRVRPVEVFAPLPVPVHIQNSNALGIGGTPVGESCASGKPCTLRLTPPAGKVIVLTGVWSASTVRCDNVMSAAPPSGAPIAPWWRCERDLYVEGNGAGYVGFLSD